MNKIYLIHKPDSEDFDWYIISDKDICIEKAQNKPLTELISKYDSTRDKILCFIASPDIVVKVLNTPPKLNHFKLKKIIPALMEDIILSKIEDIHYIYEKIDRNQYAVALISKTLINHLLDLFSNNSLYVTAIYPLIMALPIPNNAGRVFIDKEYAFVRMNTFEGFCIEKEQWSEYLQYYCKELPSKIIISHAIKEQQINIKDHCIPIEYDETPLESLILQTHEKSKFNLLPQNYMSDRPGQFFNKRIKIHLATALSLLVVFLLVASSTKIYLLNETNKELAFDIKALYRQLYPNAAAPTSVKERIEQELKTLSGKGSGKFFEFLYIIGEQLKNNKIISVTNVIFQQEQLSITLQSSNYKEIEELINKIKKMNYEIEQKKTTITEEGATVATLVIANKTTKAKK